MFYDTTKSIQHYFGVDQKFIPEQHGFVTVLSQNIKSHLSFWSLKVNRVKGEQLYSESKIKIAHNADKVNNGIYIISSLQKPPNLKQGKTVTGHTSLDK